MKKQWFTGLVALVFGVSSCIYDYEAPLTADQYTVVVEGDIQIGGYTQIRFTRLNPELMEPVDGIGETPVDYWDGWTPTAPLHFTVEGEDGSRVESDAYGTLCQLDTRTLNPSVRYRLRIEDKYLGQNYSSSWQDVEQAPVIDSLSFKVNGDQLDVMVTFHANNDSPYYCLSYDEQWEYNAYTSSLYRYYAPGEPYPDGYVAFPEDKQLQSQYGRIIMGSEQYPYYTCWNSSARSLSTIAYTGAMVSNKLVDYVFRTIDKSDNRISIAYRPIVSLRMISKESYEYWQSIDKASTQTGDLFSPIPGILRGNVTNDANPEALVIGYIGASHTVSQSSFIKDSDIHLYKKPQSLFNMLQSWAVGYSDTWPAGVQAKDMLRQYQAGYRPWKWEIFEFPNGDGAPYFVWIKERCLDCRTQGGTLEKPEGWPQ